MLLRRLIFPSGFRTFMQETAMKLFIADDNVEFRNRLSAILGDIAGIDVIGTAGNVKGAIKAIRRVKPDTVILDFRMPGGNGLDVLAAVKQSNPAPTVIMLTIGTRSEYQSICFAAGADYFFEKSSDLQKMVSMLTKLAARSTERQRIHHSSQGQL